MWVTVSIILGLLAIGIALDFVIGRRRIGRQMPTYYPERLTQSSFFSDGNHFTLSLFKDINEARDHIHLLFFIIRDDATGHDLIQRLAKKVSEGVSVRILVDYMGGFRLSKAFLRNIHHAGISFAYAHRPAFPYFFYRLNRRNHRKIVIVDGHIGYIGGFNIGDEYLGKDANFGDWRDYHLRLVGDGVQDLQQQFMNDWKRATNDAIDDNRPYFPALTQGTTPMTLMVTYGYGVEDIFISFIEKANESIVIGSAYYIPGQNVQKALLAAAKRGVAITLVLPAKSDHPFVRDASMPYFHDLLQAGASIFLFYEGFFHSKVIVIDDQLCDIGTANLDQRSFIWNDEINCFTSDAQLIETVKQALSWDIYRSEPLTIERLQNRNLFQRGKEKLATLISHFL